MCDEKQAGDLFDSLKPSAKLNSTQGEQAIGFKDFHKGMNNMTAPGVVASTDTLRLPTHENISKGRRRLIHQPLNNIDIRQSTFF